jgi:hypothetical protein
MVSIVICTFIMRMITVNVFVDIYNLTAFSPLSRQHKKLYMRVNASRP